MKKLEKLIGFASFLYWQSLFSGSLKAKGRNYNLGASLNIHSNGKFEIGELNVLSKHCNIETSGMLSMGSRNFLNRGVKIVCLDRIKIGDDCIIADSVHIYDHDHRYDNTRQLIKEQGYKTVPVTISDNVWIGAKATVLKGVSIGEGAIVGANAVVNKDVPANAIVAGNPARIVKMRTDA